MRTLSIVSVVGVLGVVAVSRDAAAIPLPDYTVANCASRGTCLWIVDSDTGSGAGAILGDARASSNSVGVSGFGYCGIMGTGGQYGVAGVAGASGGIGVHGDGLTNGIGVEGIAATWTGVEGDSQGTSGTGVLGSANASSGTTYGVYGQSASSGGAAAGVFGSGNTGGAFHGVATGIYGTCTRTGCYGLYVDAPKAYISGTLTCGVSCNSDRRLKQNIEPLPGAVKTLLQLRGVTFEWKKPEEHENRTGTQIGLIAQEVQKVFPQWVRETERGVLNVDVDPRAMAALTVESIRAIQAQNENLRERVKSLEAGQRPMMSGFGEGWIGAGLMAMAGALVFTRRKPAPQPLV